MIPDRTAKSQRATPLLQACGQFKSKFGDRERSPPRRIKKYFDEARKVESSRNKTMCGCGDKRYRGSEPVPGMLVRWRHCPVWLVVSTSLSKVPSIGYDWRARSTGVVLYPRCGAIGLSAKTGAPAAVSFGLLQQLEQTSSC
eukprot:497342-Pleurochrysis_carterae.AAC.1